MCSKIRRATAAALLVLALGIASGCSADQPTTEPEATESVPQESASPVAPANDAADAVEGINEKTELGTEDPE